MKAIYKTAIIFSVLSVLCACNDPVTPDPVNPNKKEEVQPETHTLTFVLPAEGAKAAWVAGDQIIVHGEYAKDQVTVTLDAADIAEDGKTAVKTVDGLKPYKRDDCTSSLYAAYPASAVNNLSHCFFYSGFKAGNVQLMAAYNSGDTFSFKNLTSEVSFVVKGDFESFDFTARKDVYIGFSRYQVKLTDKEENYKQYLEDPTSTISCTDLVADGVTVNRLFVPGGLDLEGGFILRFYKGGEAVKSFTDKSQIKVDVSGSMVLGDISDHLVDAADDIDPSLATRLDTDESANCYVVYESGMYRFKAVKGNSSALLEGVDHAEILWESAGTSAELAVRSIISGVSYDSETGYICFQLPTTVKPGNAVIAAVDAGKKVLWSWHIWIPATTIPSVDNKLSVISGVDIMARNLGALNDPVSGTAPQDGATFGLLYQWGRKDPFVGADAPGSTTKAVVAGKQMTVHEGKMSLSETIADPTAFVSVPCASGDTVPDDQKSGSWWTDSDDEAMNWWGDIERDSGIKKTIYDPCPAGYRVAGRKRVKFFLKGYSSTDINWKAEGANYLYQIGDPSITFPLTGFMKEDGTIDAATSYVWNSHMDLESLVLSYGVSMNGESTSSSQIYRVRGCSVRCEKVQ